MTQTTPTPLRAAMLTQRIPSLEALADKAGISRATAYRTFRNEGEVTIDVSLKIADALGIDPIEADKLIAAERASRASKAKS